MRAVARTAQAVTQHVLLIPWALLLSICLSAFCEAETCVVGSFTPTFVAASGSLATRTVTARFCLCCFTDTTLWLLVRQVARRICVEAIVWRGSTGLCVEVLNALAVDYEEKCAAAGVLTR